MMTSPPDPPGRSGIDVTPTSGHVSTCLATCAKAADCGTPGDPALRPAATSPAPRGSASGRSCKAASECAAAAHGGSFLCEATGGSSVPACVPACQKPADCVPPGNTDALEDASHFACTGGACEWLGCKATSECSASLHTSKVTCVQPAGAPGKTCVPTCKAASDCASSQGGPLTDASHYACKGGTCEWLGCKSTAECTQVLQSIKYACE